jgi:pyridoxal phosphate enzyme (YggS family)
VAGPLDEVRERVAAVRARIAAACARAGRDPAEVTLVGASKGQPVERLAAAWEAGVRVFGENRVQEAQRKAPELPSAVEWHLIGPLQSNKAKAAVELFPVVHSIDRVKIGRLLDQEAAARCRPLDGFLEVNLGAEPSKHGFPAAGLAEAITPLAGLPWLRLTGLMAIPPEAASAEAMRPWFRRLRELRD